LQADEARTREVVEKALSIKCKTWILLSDNSDQGNGWEMWWYADLLQYVLLILIKMIDG
jgi:hypothetical protein